MENARGLPAVAGLRPLPLNLLKKPLNVSVLERRGAGCVADMMVLLDVHWFLASLMYPSTNERHKYRHVR